MFKSEKLINLYSVYPFCIRIPNKRNRTDISLFIVIDNN